MCESGVMGRGYSAGARVSGVMTLYHGVWDLQGPPPKVPQGLARGSHERTDGTPRGRRKDRRGRPRKDHRGNPGTLPLGRTQALRP